MTNYYFLIGCLLMAYYFFLSGIFFKFCIDEAHTIYLLRIEANYSVPLPIKWTLRCFFEALFIGFIAMFAVPFYALLGVGEFIFYINTTKGRTQLQQKIEKRGEK